MTASDRALELARVAALAADDKLARDVVAIDVSSKLALTDVFVIASAPNERQISSIVDEVLAKMHEAGVKPVRREGERDGRWVLIDFTDVVVHVQHAEEREFYDLERLWKDCPQVDLQLPERERPADDLDADQNDENGYGGLPWYTPNA